MRNAAARTLSVAIGIVLLVIGVAGLVEGGIPDGTTPPHVEVFAFHRTAMSAVVETVVGFLFVLSGVVTRDPRGMLAMSLLVLVPGAVLLVAPGTWHDWVGAHRVTGILYVAVALLGGGAGALSLASARRQARTDRAAGIRRGRRSRG